MIEIPENPRIFFAAMSAKQVLEFLQTTREGLSTSQAERRREYFGSNEVEQPEITWWHVLLRQLNTLFIYLFIGVALLSIVLGQMLNALLIVVFLVINTLIGFYQELSALKSQRSLKEFLVSRAIVMRDGRRQKVDSAVMVPGDIVILEPGDIVPADARIVELEGLIMDESVLTGESSPVYKVNTTVQKAASGELSMKNILYAGTNVISGVATAVVIATGISTSMHTIAHLVVTTPRYSTLEKGVARLSMIILKLAVATICALLLGNILFKAHDYTAIELLLFCLALAVSVIPEALPIVVTFSLSSGVSRLAAKNVIVKRLAAVEDLGAVSILCVDKTGTITENKQTVADVYSTDIKPVLEYGAIASSVPHENVAVTEKGFDGAIWNALNESEQQNVIQYQRLREIPFDPSRLRNTVLVKKDGMELIVRGALEVILDLCAVESVQAQEVLEWAQKQGQQGRRVIAIAHKQLTENPQNLADQESDCVFLGALSFVDPIKPTAHASLVKARTLGIEVKIISGDAPEVCYAIARQATLIQEKDTIVTGSMWAEACYELKQQYANECRVFARIAPEQKYEIIRILQEHSTVGYVGDGINDAPALRAANVGLAVDQAVDIVQDLADIVLLESSLHVIIDGIEEGRRTVINTVKYIKTTMSANFGHFYAIALASIFMDKLPMLPVQILLLNLFSDFPMIALSTDSIDRKELTKPRYYSISEIVSVSLIFGAISTLFDVLCIAIFYSISTQVLQTSWFLETVIGEILFIFSMRTKSFMLRAARPSNLLIGLSVIAIMLAVACAFTPWGQRLFSFVHLRPSYLAIIALLVASFLVVCEMVKSWYYSRMATGDDLV